jgi:hypothetical protein
MGLTTLSSPLGDIRAESDHRMLDRAFYETADYKSLLESDEKVVVVGRRGTGKSALTFRLSEEWKDSRDGKSSILIVVSPDEHHTLALEPYITRVGTKFLPIRAASRMLWKYGLLLQVAQALSSRYKTKDLVAESAPLIAHLHIWGKQETHFYDKLRSTLKRTLAAGVPTEEFIAHLSDTLEIPVIEKELRKVLDAARPVRILVDRLDEGFDPSTAGVAFIDGVVTAAIDIATVFRGKIRPLIFLRDNIFRAVAYHDQDYARNIEGQTLRLHWDVNTLFYMVCNRIRAAFDDKQQNNKRLWNRYVSHELVDEDGFRHCLKFTLYRPRDILILLNSAFENASKRDLSSAMTTIGLTDIERSAKTISDNRLDDLRKEYRHIFPSIDQAVAAFGDRNPEMPLEVACDRLSGLMSNSTNDSSIQTELAIYEHPIELVRTLYSVGFFGVHDSASSSFVFSHDGRRQDVELLPAQNLLIHPCYWMGLNLSKNAISPSEGTEINDEYEIKVASITPKIRNARLGKVMTDCAAIPPGSEGSADFEQWCLNALKICFAGKLGNIALHPNADSVSRRDVVGTNYAKSILWSRIEKDYSARQVIFEVKNYEVLTPEDYRQVLSYLTGAYGNLAFVITRSSNIELERGRELDWFKEMYNGHGKTIVKLTAKFLSDVLAKLRSPQKHDAGDHALSGLLDTYQRLYLGQKISRKESLRSKGARSLAKVR